MNKMKKTELALAVARALAAGAVASLAAAPTWAQEQTMQTAPPPPAERIEKIQVTGSRIPLQTLESESPVQVITAQDIKNTGLTNIADVLNQLPQVVADYGQMLSNGSFGVATVDLRGLGPQRTLVLIDGRRLPAGDPRIWTTDLNAIPAPLIQRVDVLTGGASSIYGSDAIAGVVNFIMNDHFEGLQLEYNGNGYNHQQHNSVASAVQARAATDPAGYPVPGNIGLDGVTQDFSMTLGGNFAGGKGNATVYFEYRHSQPVLQGSRDFSACALTSTPTGIVCGGSATSSPGRFLDANTGNNWTIADAAGNVRPYIASQDQYNYGPSNYFQVPDERYLANFFAHYDALPNLHLYTEFDFMDSKTVLQIAPSGVFFGQFFTLYDSNPLLSQSFKDAFGITPTTPGSIIIGRRNVEGGGRQDEPRHTDYRIVIGGKGSFLDDKWDYDAWWQSGKVVYQDTYLHDFSLERIARAVNVVKDPRTGQPVCASVLDGTDPSCVPWNIFQLGGVTPASLNYLQTPGFQSGETAQSVAGLHVSSDLGAAYGWKLPLAKNGIGVAAGIEHRTEKLTFATDAGFSVPDLAGQGGATKGVGGQYTVNEAFAELRVPIMEGQNWADELSVNGSYRYSNYSTGPTTNTYGLGAEWAPIKEARLRGTYQVAERAPNIIELFTPSGPSLFGMTADPCGPTKSATLQQCQLTGILPSQYGAPIIDNPAGQYNNITGGNPRLSPERSTSYTFGIVFQPTRSFNATVDYWNINVSNTVGTFDPSLALTQCLTSGLFCNYIHRDAFGTLWFSGAGGYVDSTNVNIGSTKTSGIDVAATWNYSLEKYGSLGISFTGTWVSEFIEQPAAGLPSFNCAGLYGDICGQPFPRWRNVLTTTWNTPWNWNAGFRWRYYGSVAIDASSSNPQLSGPYNPVDTPLAPQNYIDLFGQWNINKNFTLRGGVNNVFDHDPPIVSSNIGGGPFGNGNTYPQVYDALGRNLFINLQAKF